MSDANAKRSQGWGQSWILWLLFVPLSIGLALATLFLWHILASTSTRSTIAIALLALSYLAGGLLYARWLRSMSGRVHDTVSSGHRVSEILSKSLREAFSTSVLYWLGTGTVFAILATIFILPGLLGFLYFFAAVLIITTLGVCFSYFAVKQLIFASALDIAELEYEGARISIARKVAIIFMTLLTITALVFILLGSAQISSTLEELAVTSAKDRFDRLYEIAISRQTAGTLDVSMLEEFVPQGYGIALLRPDGSVSGSAAQSLGERELAIITETQSGTSVGFISSNVSRFSLLPDGSIIVMTIPWEAYQQVTYQIALYGLIIALLGLIEFSVIVYYFGRDIDRPLRALRKAADNLSTGDFRGNIRVFSDDEIGVLGSSFRQTRDRLKTLVRAVAQSGGDVRNGVDVITGGSRSLLDRGTTQSELAGRTRQAISRIREQAKSVLDSASQVSGSTQDSASRAIQLRAVAEEIARIMDELFQSVEKTSSSTTEMNASANEMTKRTEYLRSVGDELLSFVSEMDSTVRELRINADKTAEISRQVREDAQSGGEAVEQTVVGIVSAQETTRRSANTLDDLQKQIGRISGILDVIEDITERTNLLSLNAAIIAAQAGEHGLGFGVVAEEIRELAERTRGSTREIGSIIKAVQSASGEAVAAMNEGVAMVDENVSQAQEASASLSLILNSANESFEMAKSMARSLQEQAQASQRLHEVTAKISEQIAEINRSTGEQARGTSLLADEAERVRDIAARVKNASEEQREAGRGISEALETIATDAAQIRDLLKRQLVETDQIAEAAESLTTIAGENEALAEQLDETVGTLADSARSFENEVSRFHI